MFLSHHLVLKGLPSLPPQLIRFDYLRRGECRYYTSNTVQKKVGKQPDKSKSHAKAKSKSPSSSKVVPSEVDKAGPLPAVSSNQRLVSLNPKSPHLHNTRGEGILKSEIQSNRVSIDIKKERPSEATIQHGTYIAETTWKDIPACRILLTIVGRGYWIISSIQRAVHWYSYGSLIFLRLQLAWKLQPW